jgi:hypothetical protein
MDNLWWHSKARWTTRKVFVALFVAGVATIASALELGPTMMKEEVLLIGSSGKRVGEFRPF